MTDSSKNIIAASTYHPFGETAVEEGSEHYLYTGKQKDSTGLYYYGARYYDPDVGRFITRDLIRGNRMNSQSFNRYSYCLNNPLKYIDPEGLIESQFSIDGGGTEEEPEVTGDPSYDGNGQITIPTSMGDVTIDLDTEEDWGDVNNKAKQNQVKKKFGELEEGRQKYREWQAKGNKKIRNRYSLMGMGGVSEIQSDNEIPGGILPTAAGGPMVGIGIGVAIIAGAIFIFGVKKSLAILTLIGLGVGIGATILIVGGCALLMYGVVKMAEEDQ